jgi:hypothetical protein
MTNTLDNIIPKIVTRGMLSFREQAIMPRLVNADFSAEAARKGDKIDVMIPGEVTVEDVVPGANNTSVSDTETKVSSIELKHWKKAAFHLSDKEIMQVDADSDFVPFHMNAAIAALAEEVNKSFYKEILRARHIISAPNKKLFTQAEAEKAADYAGINPVLEGRKILNSAKAPKSGRFGVLGFEEEANALSLSQFADVEKSGDTSIRLEGEIGRKYGIQWFGTDQIHTHTASGSDTFSPSAAITKGDDDALIRNITPRPIFGDLVMNVNDEIVATVEDVLEQKTSNSYQVKFAYPFQKTFAGSSSLKIGPNSQNNLIFHRDAFAFATRPLTSATESLGLGNRIMSVTDPETGLSMRLEISRQYKRTVWEFDVLWGVKMVRPEFAIRVIS